MGDNNKEQAMKVMLTIGVNEDNAVMVKGDLEHKNLNYHLLAEAIKIITDYKKPAIIREPFQIQHRILDFAKRFKK